MDRHLHELAGKQFDVLVVGGGAAGAAAARESALRGFHTALVEREDFASGTSAQCFKVVHGGVRYLQHGDIARLRASCRERAALLRLAPHLIEPKPFAVPTYGHGKRGKWLLKAGLRAYEALCAGCNGHVPDPSRRIQATRFLDRDETLNRFPFLRRAGLTGAAVFEDGQMYSPPRVVLAFVAAAHELGATVANYVEVERFTVRGSRVTGVVARDTLSQERFDIRARVVINATGPWAEGLLQRAHGVPIEAGTYSRDACLLIERKVPHGMGVAVQASTYDGDALVARGGRHLLMVPWRDCTLLGVWHAVVAREPDAAALSANELQRFVAELNRTLPGLGLDESEVRLAGFGLVPFGEAGPGASPGLHFGKRSRIIDHREHNLNGLVTVMSVRFTVVRNDAERALEVVERQLGTRCKDVASRTRPLSGGDITDFPRFVAGLRGELRGWSPEPLTEQLACHYGSHVHRVLALGRQDTCLRACLPGAMLTLAEVAYSVREEMAQRMTDVVFRRTGLGTTGHPGAAALDRLQEFLARTCGWTAQRAAEERAATERQFARYLAFEPPTPATALRA
jgi:glycerol-3-phosphate dehydrogenase